MYMYTDLLKILKKNKNKYLLKFYVPINNDKRQE